MSTIPVQISGKKIPTGVRKSYLPNLALSKNGWQGHPDTFRWNEPMGRNHRALKEILARNGLGFTDMVSRAYEGEADYFRRDRTTIKPTLYMFVAVSPRPVWYKYEGDCQGGGQNWVYVGQRKMKLSEFRSLSSNKQDQLLAIEPWAPKAEAPVDSN